MQAQRMSSASKPSFDYGCRFEKKVISWMRKTLEDGCMSNVTIREILKKEVH
jgi:hypothetical protein